VESQSLATNGSSATFLTGVVVENYIKPKSAEGIIKDADLYQHMWNIVFGNAKSR